MLGVNVKDMLSGAVCRGDIPKVLATLLPS